MSTRQSIWMPAYVALGSNLDDPPGQLRSACRALAALRESRLVTVSAFYGNPPLGSVVQPDFVNAVAGLLTGLSAADLLDELQRIERAQGRQPDTGVRWGPRPIDLDLLMHGQTRCSQAQLTLPHPGIAERNFVLFPLLEIAPHADIPGQGSVAGLAGRLDRGQLVPVA